MTSEQREAAVVAGRTEFGWDFFMVDPKGAAAPFRIENMRNLTVFVECASSLIEWKPASNGIAVRSELESKLANLERLVNNGG